MAEEKVQVCTYGLYVPHLDYRELFTLDSAMEWAVATAAQHFAGFDDKKIGDEYRRSYFYLSPGARDEVLNALQAIGVTDAQALEEPVLFNMR